MNISEILKATSLLLVLLNPFLVIIYLMDAVQKMKFRLFKSVLIRAGIISTVVFCLFAVLGEMFFLRFIKAEFASFQIFGGVVFLLIGIQFVFNGKSAIEGLRGEHEHIVGAITMPILIGPGTISYSVIIGQKHDALSSVIAIGLAVFISIFIMLLLKLLHDNIHNKNEQLVERYIEITGRILAIIVGTISIEMIMQGLRFWFPRMFA